MTKKIDGSWQATKLVMDGTTIPVLDELILNVTGVDYTVAKDSGTVTYFAPGALDITGVAGPNSGKTFKAIYAMKPDLTELTICYNLAGGDRPTAFLSQKGNGLLLATYTRK